MYMFLADRMVQNLGKWLRILGVQTEIPSDIGDDQLIIKALKEKKVILTKYSGLAAKARKIGASVILIPPTCVDLEEQLKIVYSKYPFKIQNEVLCTSCGSALTKKNTTEVSDKVPESVVKRFETVWVCSNCGHIFWEGSHWKNINKMIGNIRQWTSK